VLVIHNAADLIVPASDARRLAAAISSAELWITAAPVSVGDLGPFGTHVQCYKLAPEEQYPGRLPASRRPSSRKDYALRARGSDRTA
jgi:hypothetical protein